MPSTTEQTLTTEQALGRLLPMCGSSGALLTAAHELPNELGRPRIPVFLSSAGRGWRSNRFLGSTSNEVHSSLELSSAGTSLHPHEAKLKALVEGFERYASACYDESDLRKASADSIGRSAIALDTLPSLLPAERAAATRMLCRPRADDILDWVATVNAATGRRQWVPASAVYVDYRPSNPADRILWPVSTGCAAHFSLDAAIRAGLLEVFERDALAGTWLCKRPLRLIDVDAGSSELGRAAEIVSAAGLEVDLYDASTDMPAQIVIGVCWTSSVTLPVVVSAAADTSAERATLKALIDCVQALVGLGAAASRPEHIPEHAEDCHAVDHGALFTTRPERVGAAFEFLRPERAMGRISLSELQDRRPGLTDALFINSAVGYLADNSMSTVIAPLQTSELADCGLTAVRVIVPELQPLSFVHSGRYLAHARLRYFGAPATAAVSDFNPFPQPFA